MKARARGAIAKAVQHSEWFQCSIWCSTSLENAIVGFNIPPELLFASKRQMEYVAQRELKQVGIKQDISFNSEWIKKQF